MPGQAGAAPDASRTCYVHITLPGATAPVACGRFTLTPNRFGVPEGRFVYARSYLERPDAVAIDPVELKLSPRACTTTALGGLFGAIRDACPDSWGRRVIQHQLAQAQPSELDVVLQSPDDRAGALGFGLVVEPPAPRRRFNRTLDLAALQRSSDLLLEDHGTRSSRSGFAGRLDPPRGAGRDAGPALEASISSGRKQVQPLLMLGTSMGGARPKAVIEHDGMLWVAKFNRPDDAWNSARVEHAMLQLARACGLWVADSRVVKAGGRDVLLVRRFDRERCESGYLRARMVSALTLLRAEDSMAAREQWSYVLLAEELRRVCSEPAANAAELFRRMCFNALISNTDDHPRNHALIARNRAWLLSPAYDLTPSVPLSTDRRDLTMACGDLGRWATVRNLLSQAPRFLLTREDAAAIVSTMAAQVRAHWRETARAAGVTQRDCERIAPAFVYPGFGAG